MRRATLVALALLLLLGTPALAAPPMPTSASLIVIRVVADDPSAPIDERGRIDFQSDPYKGPPGTLTLLWFCRGAGASESMTPPIDKRDGTASVYFRNGIQGTTGQAYCTDWEAWVALRSDPWTPISPVVSGSLP